MNHTYEALEAAKQEGKISPAQLVCEILPLLKEYLIGDFSAKDDKIEMCFLNGDKFELSIKAI